MQLDEIIWKDKFVEKLAVKHSVTTDEVEQILFSRPHVRKAQKGQVKGEDVYVAYGQTYGGRYLVVFLIYKRQMSAALPISARDMTTSERRYYERQAEAD
ncbi:BrnT family toxin [Scytonema sp. UIC 10036]|uniref:BrnT family toxin n=1 Tax=Scytonema sp. UIC 10036 TaxID=2304196 RepID=UPI0012DA2761|nr:BrnT family toxin [Scytonema sp. UIC 10036]MUG95611.1 BrnT family toxin [Scytonema sp. UIC 10036]